MSKRFDDSRRAVGPRSGTRGVMLAVASALAASAGQAGERSTTPLSFATEAQPLFGPSFGSFGTRTEVVDLDLKFFETKVPPTQKGRIARVTEEIPVGALQNIWQRAMNTCLAQSYTVPVIGWKISPTSRECETGKVRRAYCTVPPKMSHSFPCADKRWFEKNIGAGIGPKPTQPADKPYDVGAIVTYSADVKMGVRGLMTLDGGSVDVSFRGDATLETNVAEAKPGDVVTLNTGWKMLKRSADMVSRYPAWDVSLGSYVFTDIKANAVYAGVDFETGDQIRKTATLYDARTLDSDLENTSADGIVEFADTEWFGVNLSPAGLVVRVLEQGFTVLDGSSLINESIYYPFTPKGVPPPPVRFSLSDYMLISPKLDTPAILGFDCGDCSEPALRNYVDGFGQIVNTTPVGPRTLVAGLPNEGSLPFVINNGLQDADFFRFDLDVDSISLALGTPLGVNVESPPIKFPARLQVDGRKFGPAIGFNLEALDLDVASFFSADQRLSFDPNLVVDLKFSKPVDIRLEGEAEFRSRSSISVRLGDQLSFKQVPGGVKITPTYSARDNRFVNDTRIKYALASQATFGQIELYGVIPDMSLGVFDLPQNFAVLQLTPEVFEPVTIWGSQKDPENPQAYALGGFADVVGAPIEVAEARGTDGQFSFKLRRSAVTGCKSIPATVTLASPAPAGGTIVTISDTLAAASPPASVTIPAGATTRKFSIKSSAVAESESGTVSATLGGTTLSQPLTLRPIGVASIGLAASSVVGGQDVAAAVKLDCTAAPGDIFVELSSTDAAVANPTVSSMVIPAGTRTGQFTVKTAPVEAATKPKIVAEANGDFARKTLAVTP